jgi:hypothetical protein
MILIQSVTFEVPDSQKVAQWGYTYDANAAYGGQTPIHSTYPPFQFPMQSEGFQPFMRFFQWC